MKRCAFMGCNKDEVARGLCTGHYSQWDQGRPLARIARTREERFWAKVDKSGECWIWTASRKGSGVGYGSFGQNEYAHRVSWEIHKGRIPRNLDVLHRCDNPPCVRPRHLFLGTQGDNNKDKARKGRSRNGHTIKTLGRPVSQ